MYPLTVEDITSFPVLIKEMYSLPVIFLLATIFFSDSTVCQVCFPPCDSSLYCGNGTEGQPQCLTCNDACNGCTGPGPNDCKTCATQFYSAEGSCRGCNVACNGCSGPGPDECNTCSAGFYPVGGICRGCEDGFFGVNCTGVCHCLNEAGDCRKTDGYCRSSTCEWGWSTLPDCQVPCAVDKYGKNCAFTCHCPINDTCNNINGLCASGSCHPEYGGPGCQILLPKLKDPPVVTDNVCGNISVTWRKWVKDFDIGDGPIGLYSLEVRYFNQSDWQVVKTFTSIPESGQTEEFTGLDSDELYSFRVSLTRLEGDGGKLMPDRTPGFPSAFFSTSCVAITTTTLEPPTPAPTPPPGSLFHSFVLSNGINNTIVVRWEGKNYSSVLGNVTLTYGIVGIGDCQDVNLTDVVTIKVSLKGTEVLKNMIPNRRYNVKAVIDTYNPNITENDRTISANISTQEIAPYGIVRNIIATEKSSSSVTLRWDDPECIERGGRVLDYPFLWATYPQNIIVKNDSSSTKSATFMNLSPYANYTFTVSYRNKIGTGPPAVQTFWTGEDAPVAPVIISIKPGVRNISIIYREPSPANGIIREYQLSYSLTADFKEDTNKLSKDTFINLSELQPFRTYYMKVRARTLPGLWGNFSSANVTQTLQAIPGVPETLSLTAINESCLNLKWTEPSDVNGIIENYSISYGRINVAKTTIYVQADERTYLLCGLEPYTQYEVQVAARTAQGYGDPKTKIERTLHGVPDRPPIPTLKNVTETTITIEIYPFKFNAGPVTTFVIYIDEISTQNGRKRRQITNTPPGRPVASFADSEITTSRIFVIGDGKEYGGYKNPPLIRDTSYNVYYEVMSVVGTNTKTNYSKMLGSATTTPVLTTRPPSAGTVQTTSDNTAVIIVVIIIILLLIIVGVVLFILWYRRRTNNFYPPAYELYEDEQKQIPSFVDDYDPHEYWNKIYSLRESRYIIAGRDLVPDDGYHGTIHNGNIPANTINPPVTFQQEFHELPHEPLASWNDALNSKNSRKNRFRHLLPYDHTRVVLNQDENSSSDFINANFVKGYNKPHEYIAAQSPFDEETVLDFWRMLYQYNVKVVVMITNVIEDRIVKCSKYWPDSEMGKVKYGNFNLALIDELQFADYVIRTVKIKTKFNGNTKVVHIFDFCSWPDHGVPDDTIPLLEFRHKVREYRGKDKSPIVVHCGTGVSRTGTFIAIDSLLEQYDADGMISVFSFVRRMRKDRVAMVRTIKQYIFIYEAIFEARVAGETRAGYDLKEKYHTLTMRNPKTKHSFLRDRFLSLQQFTRKPTPKQCSDALLPINYMKNRFSDVIPPNQYRPVLKTPGGIDRTDYINAVFVDSHELRNHFIITQSPLHTTVIDFWKLVYDHDVCTIVMMEDFKNEDDTTAEYWPEDKIKKFEPFFVDNTNIWQQENVTIRHFKLHNMLRPKDTPREVRQFQFNAWNDSDFVPKSKTMLLDLVDLAKSWQEQSNGDSTPVLVHCKDGATHSGLFCAVWTICETMENDHDVDVFHTVKHMKRRRPQIIDTVDQYRFCYKALWDFMNLRMPGGTLTNMMNHTRQDRLYNVGSLSLASYTSHLEYM